MQQISSRWSQRLEPWSCDPHPSISCPLLIVSQFKGALVQFISVSLQVSRHLALGTSSQTPLCRMEWIWTTVGVKFITTLRGEGPSVGWFVFTTCARRRFCYPVLQPPGFFLPYCQLCLLHGPSLDRSHFKSSTAQFISFLFRLVGWLDGLGWTRGGGLPPGGEVAGFHNKARWDPRIVGWIRYRFKLCWQTGVRTLWVLLGWCFRSMVLSVGAFQDYLQNFFNIKILGGDEKFWKQVMVTVV